MSLTGAVLRGYRAQSAMWLPLMASMAVQALLSIVLLSGVRPERIEGVAFWANIVFCGLTYSQMQLARQMLAPAHARLIPGVARGHALAQLLLLLPRVGIQAAFLMLLGETAGNAIASTCNLAGIGLIAPIVIACMIAGTKANFFAMVVTWIPAWVILANLPSIMNVIGPLPIIAVGLALCALGMHSIPALTGIGRRLEHAGSGAPSIASLRKSTRPGLLDGAIGLARWLPGMVCPMAFSASVFVIVMIFMYVLGKLFTPLALVCAGLGALPFLLLMSAVLGGDLVKTLAPLIGREAHATAVILGFWIQASAAWIICAACTGMAAAWVDWRLLRSDYLAGLAISAAALPLLPVLAASVALLRNQLLRLLVWAALLVAVTVSIRLALERHAMSLPLAVVPLVGFLAAPMVRRMWLTADLAW